jgi:hypothetical protein
MKRAFSWFLPALGLLVMAGGCNRSDLFQATGRLTYKGQPVPNTYVRFVPEAEGKRASNGLTDANGRFALNYSRTETGVLRGKHNVALRYRTSADEEAEGAKPTPEMRSVIARFGDARTTDLHFEVVSSGQHFEIDLK